MVIWLTGLSGAGKTTVARKIIDRLKPKLPQLVLIDGDVIRALFGADLDYTEASREIQVRRLQALAKMLSDQGQIAIVTVLYSRSDFLAWNRDNFADYFEVYMDAPLELVQRRDPKGLYKKAASGEMPDVVGIDIPWYPPSDPDIHITFENSETPDDVADRIIAACPVLNTANTLQDSSS